MAISFGGINTGLPPNLVEQLMEAERQPIKNLEQKKGKSQSRLDLMNDLEGRISGVRDGITALAGTKSFSDMKLISGDQNIISGEVDPEKAMPGSWNIEVMQLAQKPAAVTNGFADTNRTELGVGYISFKTPDGIKEVYIDGTSSTLEGVVKKVNQANIGLKASIINDRKKPDAPYRLMISGDSFGNDNQIEFPTLYFLDGDQDVFFEEKKSAANGIIKIDGFETEVSDNKITDYIPGVTLELKQAAPGKVINITVKENLELVSGKIKDFVASINKVLSFIQTQNSIDAHTDTTKTLGGDSSLLRPIETSIRRLIQDPIYGLKGDIKYLNQLGIQYNRNGTLDFDQEKFNAALTKNPNGVQEFFVGNGVSATGFVSKIKNTINTLLNKTFGPIGNRKKGLQQNIDQTNIRIENQEKQLAKKEQQLKDKFSKLEGTMSKLKSQGAAVGSLGGGGINPAQLNLQKG